MWARLKQVGWTWKQGSGLHPYSYFRPGANTSLRKGALEGRDYFSTEASVVQFVKSRPVWKSKFYGAFKGPAGPVPLIFTQIAADQRPPGQDRRRGRRHAATRGGR